MASLYRLIKTEEYLSTLKQLQLKAQQRIERKVETLASNPFQKGTKKVERTIFRRLRVGDYRVLYDVQGKAIEVWLVEILPNHKYKKARNIQSKYLRKYH